MGRNYSPVGNNELTELITEYETAKAKGKNLYMDASQLAEIAGWYALNQKFEEAQDAITFGLHLHPDSTALQVEQAYLYLDQHKLEQAKQVACQIREEYDLEVKLLKAELLLNEDLLEDAQQMLLSIEDIDQLEIFIHIVTLFLDMGYHEVAKEWLDRAESQYAGEEDFLALKADYLLAVSMLKEAVVCLDKLIDKAPFNPHYWLGLARAHFMMQNIDKSLEACDFALAANDKFGEAYALKANCYLYLNNDDLSIENCKKAMELKAFPPQLGHMFMGLAYANKGMWREALESLNIVIDLYEKAGEADSMILLDVYSNKICALCRLEKTSEALLLCKRLQELYPEDPLPYLSEGKVRFDMDMEKEARKALLKAAKISPDVDTWYMIGCTYSDYNYLEDAKRAYRKAYKLNPQFEDLAEKLCVLSILTYDTDSFLQYNQNCKQPFDRKWILKLMEEYKDTKDILYTLHAILEHLKE